MSNSCEQQRLRSVIGRLRSGSRMAHCQHGLRASTVCASTLCAHYTTFPRICQDLAFPQGFHAQHFIRQDFIAKQFHSLHILSFHCIIPRCSLSIRGALLALLALLASHETGGGPPPKAVVEGFSAACGRSQPLSRFATAPLLGKPSCIFYSSHILFQDTHFL